MNIVVSVKNRIKIVEWIKIMREDTLRLLIFVSQILLTNPELSKTHKNRILNLLVLINLQLCFSV